MNFEVSREKKVQTNGSFKEQAPKKSVQVWVLQNPKFYRTLVAPLLNR